MRTMDGHNAGLLGGAVFYTKSHCEGLEDLNLSVSRPQPLERADYRCVSPYVACVIFVYPTFFSVKYTGI